MRATIFLSKQGEKKAHSTPMRFYLQRSESNGQSERVAINYQCWRKCLFLFNKVNSCSMHTSAFTHTEIGILGQYHPLNMEPAFLNTAAFLYHYGIVCIHYVLVISIWHIPILQYFDVHVHMDSIRTSVSTIQYRIIYLGYPIIPSFSVGPPYLYLCTVYGTSRQ